MPNGWVQLPFYATKNAAPEVSPEWDFVGTSANSFKDGASGVLGIPLPPDAARVRKIRVAGEIVKGEVTVTLTRSRVGKNNRRLANGTIQSGKPMRLDEEWEIPAGGQQALRIDDTLSLSIRAAAGKGHRTHIHFVAVQFQRTASY